MCKECAASGTVRVIFTLPEVDVVTSGEGAGVQVAVQGVRGGASMKIDLTEVIPQSGFKEAAVGFG